MLLRPYLYVQPLSVVISRINSIHRLVLLVMAIWTAVLTTSSKTLHMLSVKVLMQKKSPMTFFFALTPLMHNLYVLCAKFR